MSPSSSRAGAIGPSVTAFFSVASSRSAADRIAESASVFWPLAPGECEPCGGATTLNLDLLGPVTLVGLRQTVSNLLQHIDRLLRRLGVPEIFRSRPLTFGGAADAMLASIDSCQYPTRVNVCDGMCSACGADGAMAA